MSNEAEYNAKLEASQCIGQGAAQIARAGIPYSPKKTISFREVGNGWLIECYNDGALLGFNPTHNSFVASTINEAFEIALEKFFEKAK